jgi:hypothetical protein
MPQKAAATYLGRVLHDVVINIYLLSTPILLQFLLFFCFSSLHPFFDFSIIMSVATPNPVNSGMEWDEMLSQIVSLSCISVLSTLAGAKPMRGS